VFGLLPLLTDEFRKYPAVYRTQEAMQGVMAVGLAATLVAILVLAVLYAMACHGGSGIVIGAISKPLQRKTT
jgi:hypothetical protein